MTGIWDIVLSDFGVIRQLVYFLPNHCDFHRKKLSFALSMRKLVDQTFIEFKIDGPHDENKLVKTINILLLGLSFCLIRSGPYTMLQTQV